MFSVFRRNLSAACRGVPCLTEVNLVGRDYITPKNFIPQELQALVWTALDLRQLYCQKCLNVPAVKNARLLLISDRSRAEVLLPLRNASRLLECSLTSVVDPTWKNRYIESADFGRLVSLTSDVIFCDVEEQCKIEGVADGAPVPVVTVDSHDFSLIKSAADLMTLQQHFGRLKQLTLSWVGLSNSIFKSYLYILPGVGVNIKYSLVDSGAGDINCFIETARRCSRKYNTEIHQFSHPEKATSKVDVISTSAHNCPGFKLAMTHVNQAAMNWAFLHALPRGTCEVHKEVFKHENCLAWKVQENLQWVYAALIVRLLTCYTHVMQKPDFDNECAVKIVPKQCNA